MGVQLTWSGCFLAAISNLPAPPQSVLGLSVSTATEPLWVHISAVQLGPSNSCSATMYCTTFGTYSLSIPFSKFYFDYLLPVSALCFSLYSVFHLKDLPWTLSLVFVFCVFSSEPNVLSNNRWTVIPKLVFSRCDIFDLPVKLLILYCCVIVKFIISQLDLWFPPKTWSLEEFSAAHIRMCPSVGCFLVPCLS